MSPSGPLDDIRRTTDGSAAPLTENKKIANSLKRNVMTHIDETPGRRETLSHVTARGGNHTLAVALLTGGSDRPYVFGLTTSLLSKGISIDLVGSDELDTPEFNGRPGINFLKLRGSQLADASLVSKIARISMYYARLIRYAATAKPKIFHILWNNKFEMFDRTLLMLYYKALSKKVVFTAHNVNAAKRDRNDTMMNRITLQIQYRLADHIFVHTERMKSELVEEFGTQNNKVTVIPFGINNSVPNSRLSTRDAKRRLGLRDDRRQFFFLAESRRTRVSNTL